MNNLIYTICDGNYKTLLDIFVKQIKKYNVLTDLLVICPENFQYHNDVLLYKIKDFDYKYTSKYCIINYEKIKEYDNILYLDTDIVCNYNLKHVFDTIESDHNILHGVKEIDRLKDGDYFHKFLDQDIPQEYMGYNAGTFGFNINMLDNIKEFFTFIQSHLDKFCDQPIFNMFFNSKNLIKPTLNHYVFLDNDFQQITTRESCQLLHFLGCYGDAENKIKRIKDYVKN